jgi:NAD-dependent DNA ligase
VSKGKKASNSNQFKDEVIVFTGFRNKEWATIIEERGGTAGAGVTKKTTLVVAKEPDSDTGKMKEARDKGIKIVSIAEFEKMMGL